MQKDSNSMESTTEQYDIASLEILNKCHLDLFPKNKPIYDDNNLADSYKEIESKLVLLCGEYIQFIGKSGKINEDFIILTNYRLFILLNNETSFINFPVMLIENVEIKEIFYIYVYLKNAKTIKLLFSTNEKCLIWYQRLIQSFGAKITKLDDLFAFRFYSWHMNEKIVNRLEFDKFDPRGLAKQEFDRMDFDKTKWRLTRVNAGHKLCPTYPELLIVPEKISDDQLQKIATFRSSKRFPAVVWKSKINDCVIARSSQPNVGLLAWRLAEDEQLFKLIANNCYKPSVSSNHDEQQQQQQDGILLIIDARARSVALANRVKGGGYEYSEYYTNCEIQFMNLENIHVIRSSFHSLRLLCQSLTENRQFYSKLESTNWLLHLSGIIKAARTVVNSIDRQSKPVLIHCSDGWDRTPQVLALAKILLDPHFRTIKGFQILIELDWLMFGHQFAKRNGHAVNHTDMNERCPIFLQWLDCVHQMIKQFPNAFEFNETFLLKLCFHSYSCLFGTFLCDSYDERSNEHVHDRTFSVWSYLNNEDNKIFVNYLYDDTLQDVLYPKYELVNLNLWTKLFCDSDLSHLVKVNDDCLPQQQILQTQKSVEQLKQQVAAATNDIVINKLSPIIINNSNNKEKNDEELSFSFSPPTQIISSNNHHDHETSILSTSSSSSMNDSIIQAPTKLINGSIKINGKIQSSPLKINNNNNNNNNQHRRRSLNDITKFSYDSNEHIHLINHTSHNSNSDEPIQYRSSNNLQSNLLADALETNFGTTPITSSFMNVKKSSFINMLMTTSTSTTNHDVIMPLHQPKEQEENNIEVKAEIPAEVETATTTVIDEIKKEEEIKILKFQKSTDTLVDDEIDGGSNKIEKAKEEDENKNIINFEPLKTVSTSTSGLSDFVYTTQIRAINDSIKKFEQIFKNHNKINNNNDQTNYKNNLNSKIYLNNNNNNHILNGNSNSSNNSTISNSSATSSNCSSRSSSSSCLSSNNNNNNSNVNTAAAAANNVKKKTIKQLIDIDGLTSVEDNCSKRLIKREEEYKKEIAVLRAQVQKCKSFITNLSKNPFLFDANFDINEFDINSRYDENYGDRHNSINNNNNNHDSTCSSWDEINEPDYGLTTWVPDHLVTHCNHCNQRFNYAVRKHHCRHCGHIFCFKCSNQYFPLPNQNLNTPVRVCISCKPAVEQLNLITSSSTSSSSSNTTTTTATNNNNNDQIVTAINNCVNNRQSSSPIQLQQQKKHQFASSNCNGNCNQNNIGTSSSAAATRCCIKQKSQNQLVNDHKSQKVSV